MRFRDEEFCQQIRLGGQTRRAAVSTMANIAEGFERFSFVRFINCIYLDRVSKRVLCRLPALLGKWSTV
jgi:four helix bundle protein